MCGVEAVRYKFGSLLSAGISTTVPLEIGSSFVPRTTPATTPPEVEMERSSVPLFSADTMNPLLSTSRPPYLAEAK